MKKLINYLALAFGLLFMWAAYVQLNDPDAGLWILIYFVAALASFLMAIKRLPYWAAFVLAIVYGVLAIVYWPDAFEGVRIGEGDITNIERGRESLGMGITAILFIFFGITSKK